MKMTRMEHEEMRYAIKHNAFEGEITECDQCGKNTAEVTAAIWDDTVVICENCGPQIRKQRIWEKEVEGWYIRWDYEWHGPYTTKETTELDLDALRDMAKQEIDDARRE